MALWGKVLDQANIIKSTFDDLEKTVIKASRHDEMVRIVVMINNMMVSSFMDC
jgi:hypothetical protein